MSKQVRTKARALLCGGAVAAAVLGLAGPAIAAQPPANDSINNAEEIYLIQPPGSTTVEGSTQDFQLDDATVAGDESYPSCATGDLTSSLWYHFIPQHDLVIDVNAAFATGEHPDGGSNTIDIYSGTEQWLGSGGCADTRAANSQSLTIRNVHVARFMEYWVQVGGTDGRGGNGSIVISGRNAPPVLSQTNSLGRITLTVATSEDYQGCTVYFFQRSGITGKVSPQGTAKVNGYGVATRTLHKRRGQVLALYAKVLGARDIYSPYSNTIQIRTS